MSRNKRFLAVLVCVFLAMTSACKTTSQVKDDVKSELESAKISPADLAQLRDSHKLNPDNAIVSGIITKVENGVTLEVDKLEKQGFGFSESLKKGDEIAITGGRGTEGLKKGQTVLLVVSAFRMPGTSVSYNLEKVLFAK